MISHGAEEVMLTYNMGSETVYIETTIPNSQNPEWKRCVPLHEACKNGHTDMVKLLLNHGAKRYSDFRDAVS